MILSNDKVSLRAPEPADLDFLFLLENDPDALDNSLNTAPVSRQQMWAYIDTYNADIFATSELRLVIVDNESGRAVGAVDLTEFSPRDRRAFVGIAIDADFRGRGLGRAALSLLCAYAADTLGIHALAAIVAAENAASRALFASCGFRTCGRLRSWLRHGNTYHDAQLYQRLMQ